MTKQTQAVLTTSTVDPFRDYDSIRQLSDAIRRLRFTNRVVDLEVEIVELMERLERAVEAVEDQTDRVAFRELFDRLGISQAS